MGGVFGDQAYIVAPIFVLSGTTKILASAAEIDRTGLAELVRSFGSRFLLSKVRFLWIATAGVELVAAALLLTRISPLWVGSAGAGLGAVFAVYTAWILRSRPGSACGCFGSGTPATWRSFVRAALITAMLAVYATSTPNAGFTLTPGIAAVVALEVIGVIALSSELRPWLRRAKLALARGRRWFGVAMTDVLAVRRLIEKQEVWREIVASCGRAPQFRAAWRDGRWYIVEYGVEWRGELVTLVGAEYVGVHPPWVRIVMAREGTNHDATVIGAWDSVESARAAALGAQARPPTGLQLLTSDA
jgi:uncharacterized membrane protein YphA (DoxX/SURF4 family)